MRREPEFNPLDHFSPAEEVEALGAPGLPVDVQRAFTQLAFIAGAEEPAEVIKAYIEMRLLGPQAKRRLKMMKRPSGSELRDVWRKKLKECGGKVESAAEAVAAIYGVTSRTVYLWLKRFGISSPRRRAAP